jgi:photosystem II stability/assembly factor-like uncharacterized protein
MNRKVFLVTAVALLFAACGSLSVKHLDKGPDPYPNDQFFFARMYPDTVFPLETYRSALQEVARQSALNTARTTGADWVQEGPYNISGRMNTVVIHPDDPDILLVGLASGGIFKTVNGGDDWYPVFDNFSWLAISHIVFDPVDPNVVYAGTGDLNISGYPFIGDGIYKSEDQGETWENTGLTEVGIVSRMVVHPSNPDIIYAGAMGIPFERTDDRGLYKSTDAGLTWEQVLFIDDDAGVIDVVSDPANPDVVYAASWNRIRNNHESMVSGPDAGIWKSTDGGASWNELVVGLPGGSNSRISIEMHPVNPDVLYATYVGTSLSFEGMYKTTNGGSSWSSLDIGPVDDVMSGFGWYFDGLAINPYDPDQLFVRGVDLVKTEDDGDDWEDGDDFTVHADKHAMAFFSANEYILATDGGLYITSNDGNTWTDLEDIQSSQFYHVDLNPHEPGLFWGGMQDNGTAKGKEDLDWDRIYGGDGFHSEFRADDPDVFYVEWQSGNIVGNDGSDFFDATDGIDNFDRRNWNTPYMISRFDNDVLYAGTYRMYKSDNGVYPDFTAISPDLTDGIIFASSFHTLTTIDEDHFDPDVLYTGSTDANVYRTLNGGASWDNVSLGLPEHYVTDVVTSPSTPDRVFVTHSGYKENEFIPHVHRSDDNGDTWVDISGNLPELAVNAIAVHPNNDDKLFVATDGGVYFTYDGGENWDRLGNNMPVITVYDIEFDYPQNKVIAGSYARGIWSIDVAGWVPPTVVVSGVLNVCEGDSITLEASGAGNYSWTLDGEEIPCSGDCSVVEFIAAATGTVEVIGEDDFGLSDTTELIINVDLFPVWGAEPVLPSYTECEIDVYCCFIIQEPDPDIEYLWYNELDELIGEGDSVCSYSYGMNFYIQAVSSYGCTSTLYVNNGYPMGITELDDVLRIYPNPVNDFLVIETGEHVNGHLLKVHDYLGKPVINVEISGKTTIDVRSLPPGVYFVNLEGHVGSIPLVVQ